MESIESIRVEQPTINHTMIRHAEQLCFYGRQTAGGNKMLRVCIFVSVCVYGGIVTESVLNIQSMSVTGTEDSVHVRARQK